MDPVDVANTALSGANSSAAVFNLIDAAGEQSLRSFSPEFLMTSPFTRQGVLRELSCGAAGKRRNAVDGPDILAQKATGQSGKKPEGEIAWLNPE
ncbi:hypothetical protein [uncultured Roseibium sp.]|uniref:hypothetical protein n=1 Tax=uncultured Roseibium sp. TaxID=1936171 RepID=UPI0032170AE3